MRTLSPCLLLLLVTACDRPSAPTVPQHAPGAVEQVAATELPAISGYYEDTLPCADCPGIVTQLWVRSDSTYILRQHYIDREPLPFGSIGQWHYGNDVLRLEGSGDGPDFFRPTSEGLLLVNEQGEASSTGLDNTLDRNADESPDEIPRMRITGTFTYFADAMNFRPCGARSSWPCAGGEEWTDEGERGSLNSRELERHYLRSVAQGGDPWTIEVECTMAMGPAMEGDGADEYIFIHRVLGEVQGCPQ
ncbi:MAG: copper resistance protein NlpE N-terminal domain-containing protein [Flavobacteriales bacterium]|nr:copper resistance protein NlpE N-terminal domain-containing protein [Flavobacteriales bacterium]